MGSFSYEFAHNMTWQIVNLAGVPPTPWKNGGGTTRELIAWPDAEHWVWRMSVAELAQSGPFSRFDGVQRWFAVLGGAGVTLNHNGQRHRLTVDSAPFRFDGGLPTACDLIDGATQDFNLMMRVAGDADDEAGVATQTGASATMTRVHGSASIRFGLILNTIKRVAVYAYGTRAIARFNGEITPIPPHSLAWRTVAAHDDIQIEGQDALLIEIEIAAIPVNPARHAVEDKLNLAATDPESAS